MLFLTCSMAKTVPSLHEHHRNDLTKKIIISCIVHSENRLKVIGFFACFEMRAEFT